MRWRHHQRVQPNSPNGTGLVDRRLNLYTWADYDDPEELAAWGTIGWLYDTSVIKKPIKSWTDFMSAAQTEASGRTAIINTGVQIAALYFWANNKNFNTTSKGDLEKMSDYMLNTFAQHVSAVDSLPYNTILDSQYALMQGYNGALRTTLSTMKDAGVDVSTWKWGVGAPVTEKFMDNWCIVKGARHLDAAYDFINFMLNPVNSARSAAFIGSNTGTSSLSAMLPPDTQFKDMFFFNKDEIDRMKTWEYSTAIDFLNEFAVKMADKVNSGNRIKG